MRDMKTPIKCAAVGVLVNVIMNLSLIDIMQHRGLALATSIAAIVNAICLGHVLTKKYKHVRIIETKTKIIKIIMAALLSVIISVAFYNIIVVTVWMPRVIYLVLAVLMAVIIYLLCLIVLKIDEVKILLEIVRRK